MAKEFILLPNDNGASLYSYNCKVPRSISCEWFLSKTSMQTMGLYLYNCPGVIKVLSVDGFEQSQIPRKSRIGIMQLRKKLGLTDTDVLVVDSGEALFLYGSSDTYIDKWAKRELFGTTIVSLSEKLIENYGLKGYVVPDYYKQNLESFVYKLLIHSSVPLSSFYAPIFAKKEKHSYGSTGNENSVECIVKDTEVILPVLLESLLGQIDASLKNYTRFIVISPSYYFSKCFHDITSNNNHINQEDL